MLFKTIMVSLNGLLAGSSITLAILKLCGFAINPLIGLLLGCASFIPAFLADIKTKKISKWCRIWDNLINVIASNFIYIWKGKKRK